MAGRGLYFLNCTNGTAQRSCVAIYNTFVENGGNNDQPPDFFGEVTGIEQGFFTWEDGVPHVVTVNSESSESFEITFTISTTAASENGGGQVGTANIERNFGEHWEVFRDNQHVLLNGEGLSDGFTCRSFYFSREVEGQV